MKHLLLAGAAIAGLSFATAAQAALIIQVNGSTVASSAANTTTNASGTLGSATYSVSMQGIDLLGAVGAVQDVAAQISSTGAANITFDFIQTDLTHGGSEIGFDLRFLSSLIGQTVTRSIYFDANNTGAAATLLGSVATGGLTDVLASVPLSGNPFSLRETISFAVNSAAFLSSDDLVKVPEPASIALLGAGLLGLAGLRRRRRA